MAENERDWRLNPNTGDVLRRNNTDYPIEMRRGYAGVFVRRTRRSKVGDGLLYKPPAQFRKWAANATIIRRGDS